MAAGEMFRKSWSGAPESSEIDDALDSGQSAGFRKVPRCLTIPLLEVAPGPHRVNEVIGHIESTHRHREAWRIEDVAGNAFSSGVLECVQAPGIACHGADLVALRQELPRQSPADVAGGAGHEDRQTLTRRDHEASDRV